MPAVATASPDPKHTWIEERVFQHSTLKKEKRRYCKRCKLGWTTFKITREPCAGSRVAREIADERT